MTDQRLNEVPCIQGDATWFTARVGSVTGSRVAEALALLKRGGESAARRNYRLDLVIERLTGKAVEHYVSAEMEWGTANEPLARAAYEERTGAEVELVGYVLHPTIEWAGCSPDGLVGADGLVEFKCPSTRNHLEYMLDDCVPADYLPQMHWQLACCPGRKWCDFVSFDPRLPEDLQLFVCRLERDEQRIAIVEAEVRKFLAEVDEMVKRLRVGKLEQSLTLSIAKARAGLPFAVTDEDVAAVMGRGNDAP